MAIFEVVINGLGALTNIPSGAYEYAPSKFKFPQTIFGLEKSSQYFAPQRCMAYHS